ncbi:hypothetical protein BSKO_08484 [Bryopsis sp. KO-2023]|nr:hypothetical protein BSKO_08484 [Bryopsis sp. KO-2023]
MQPVAVSDADILENSEGRDDRNCGGEKMDPCMTDRQDRVAPEDLGQAPMCDDLTGEVALRVDRTRVCVVQEEGVSGIEECDTIMGEAFFDGGGEEENPLVSANIMSTDDVQRPDPGPSQICDITGHKRGREDWIKECSMADGHLVESSQPQSEVGSKWLESVPLECEISTGKVGCNIQDVGTLRLIGPESSAAPPVPVFVYDCDRPLPWSSKARVMKFCFVCLTSKSGLWFSNPRCCQSICDGCTLGLVRKGVNVHGGAAECSVRFPGMGGKRFYNMLRKVLGEKLRVRKASGDAERWKSRKQVAGRLLSCSLSPSDIGPDGLPIWRSIELTHGESEKSDSQEDADQNDIVDGETNQDHLNLNQDGCGGENEIDVVMEDPRSERSLELPSDDKEELASGVEEMPILHVTATRIADGNATRSAPPPALESVPAGRLEDFGEIPGFIDEENVVKVGKNVEGGAGAQPHVGVSIGITVPRETYFADIPRLPCPMMQGGRGIGNPPVKEKKLNAAQTRHLHQSRRLKAIRKMVAQGMPHSTAAQHCQMMSSSGPVESTRCVGADGNENGAGVSQTPQPTLPDMMAMSAVSVPVELPSLASLDVPASLPPFVLDIVTKHCGLTVEGKGTSSGSAPQKPIALEYRRAMCPVLGPSVTAQFTDARIRAGRAEDLKKIDMHFTPYGLMNMTIEPHLPSLELKKIVKGRSGSGDAGNQPPFVPNLTSLSAARAMIRASGPLAGSEGDVGQSANKGFQLRSNSRCLWCKKYLDPCKANAPPLNSARLCEACSAAPGCPSRQRHHQIISIDGAGENQHAIPSADLGVIDLLSDGEPSPPEAPQIEVETEEPPPKTPENPESEEEKEKEEAVAQPNLNENELDKLMPLLQALETAVGEPRKKRLPWWMALYNKFETNGFIPRSKRSPRLVHRIGWLERDGPRVKRGRVIENERVSAFISDPTDPLDHYKSMYRRKRLRLNSQTFTKGREKNSARGGKLGRKKRRSRRGGRLDGGESGSIPWAHLFKKSPLQDCNGGGVENRGKAGRMPDVVSIDFNEESGSGAAERIQIVCQNCGVLRMVSDVESFVRLPSKVRSRCRDCRKDMEISSPRRARKLDRCCRKMEKGIRRWWQDLGALPRDAVEDEVLSETLSSTSEEPELRSDGSVGDFLSPFRLSRLLVNRDDPTPGIVSVAFGLLPPFGSGSRKRALSMKEANRGARLEGQFAGGSSSGVRLDRSCSLKERENLNLQGENREEIGGAVVEHRGDSGADSGGPEESMGKTRPVAAKPLLSIDHDLDACEEGLLTLDGDCGMDLVEKTDGDYLYPRKGSRAWKSAFNIVRGWSESHTQAKLTRYGLSGLMCGLMKKAFIQSEDL